MLLTLKRISVFWILVILISQARASSSASSPPSTSSKDTNESPSSSASSPSEDTAVAANTFSFQGIKEFLFKGRGVDIARTFSSLRGSIGTPLTALMYMGSLAVGAIVMLAFYESPISPLPVPPLPDPPVGRFPPEHPIWPPPSHNSGPAHRHQVASPSEHHPVAVRPPMGYIHRRAGIENHYKGHQRQPQLNSIKPKIAQKATKLSSGSEGTSSLHKFDLKPVIPGPACNETVCETNGSSNSTTLATIIRNRPAKLFDILMPRTSENGKQSDQ